MEAAMEAAMAEEVYVYLPDDEPETQLYNGVVFHLEANASTLIVAPPEWPAIVGVVDDEGRPGNISMAEAIARHIVEKLEMWGACRVRGAVKDCKPVRAAGESKEDFGAREALDQAVISRAEFRYLKSTHTWCTERIMDSEKAAKPLREAGLPLAPPSQDALSARKWEKSYQSKLKGAGLIA